MPHFPLFADLTGKRVLIVGDTPAAKQKAKILAPFHADLQLIDSLTQEALTPAPALVILTGENRREEAALCRSRNIPVNSADDPENCTVFFPSLICRGDFCIGISSGGAAPAAGAALRREIEEALPENLEEILPWLGQITARLRQSIPDYDRRAKILAALSRDAFQKNRPLTGAELEKHM